MSYLAIAGTLSSPVGVFGGPHDGVEYFEEWPSRKKA